MRGKLRENRDYRRQTCTRLGGWRRGAAKRKTRPDNPGTGKKKIFEADRGPGSGPRPAAAISLQVGDGKWTWGRQIREGGCKLRL